MKEILLAKYGEIVLKGLNRNYFESVLFKNVREALRPAGGFLLSSAQSTLYIFPEEGADIAAAAELLSRVFGLVNVISAAEAKKDMEDIARTAAEYLKEKLSAARTFKVEAKRSDKKFSFTSPEICAQLGGRLLSDFPNLKVDVHEPEVTVTVEIRESAAYIHSGGRRGAGGVPVGTSGGGLLLLSGGIDSPVAGYMMARRGLSITAVYFSTPPYTSPQAEQKVISLAKALSRYAGRLKLYVAPLTEYQEAIAGVCPQELFTILLRRGMVKAAEIIARREKCGALITGESLGQVASQTIPAMEATQEAASLMIFRPLIGMDKEDIVIKAREIGTFETSIEPYDDCCSLFSPRHPKLRPSIEEVKRAEALIDADGLAKRSADAATKLLIGGDRA